MDWSALPACTLVACLELTRAATEVRSYDIYRVIVVHNVLGFTRRNIDDLEDGHHFSRRGELHTL